MANIVTSFVTELLPTWMERKARREQAQPAPVEAAAAAAPPDQNDRARQARPAPPRVHRPKSPPSHWRASSM